jgi:hypothetical protein
MSLRDTLSRLVSRPVGLAASGLTLVSGWLGMLDPAIQFVSATAGTWFPAIAVGSQWVLPQIPAVPDGFGTDLIIAAAVVYVAILLSRLGRKAKEKYL